MTHQDKQNSEPSIDSQGPQKEYIKKEHGHQHVPGEQVGNPVEDETPEKNKHPHNEEPSEDKK